MSAYKPSLFLAFPDGVYQYDCRSCSALCCRGHGFGGNLKREMGRLLEIYPNLGHYATNKHGDMLGLETPVGGCHFLDPDNRCRIEKEHGKALKPGVCSLFPFNVLSWLGSTIVISPHFLCPLRLEVPAKPGSVAGTHEWIEAAARESGLLLAPPPANKKRNDSKILLARERRFRDASSEAIGRLETFREFLLSLSEKTELDSFTAQAAQVLGIQQRKPAPRDSLDDILLALAPPLRLELLNLGEKEALRALAVGEVVVRELLSHSPAAPTIQGAVQILRKKMPLLRLLARKEGQKVPDSLVEAPPKFGDPALTLKAYCTIRDLHRGLSPISALQPTVANLSLPDRSVLLFTLGQAFDKPGDPRRETPRKGSVKRDPR